MKKRIVDSAGVVGTAVTLGLAGCGEAAPPPETPETPASEVTSEDQPAPPDMGGESDDATDSTDSTDATAGAEDTTDGLDCEGPAQFTEACGYGSPTRYAALDSNGIVNEG